MKALKLTTCANGCGVVLPKPASGPAPTCGACLKDGPARRAEAERRKGERPIRERNYD